MFAWVVIREEQGGVLAPGIARAWRGAAVVARPTLPVTKRKPPRPILVVTGATATGGNAARRAPRWPDVLVDWHEINEEPLFPSDDACVLAEELSGLGAPTLCAHGGPGLVHATVAWYERGALIGYEHVGATSVSWDPDDGLGRPFDGTAESIAALGGARVAKLFGSDRDVDVLERQALANRAVGDVLLVRAFHRLLEQDPPPIDDLAGLVATAPTMQFPA